MWRRRQGFAALCAIAVSCGDAAAPGPPCLAAQVTGGVSETWVLKNDGTVWAWGNYAVGTAPAQVPAARIDGLPPDTVGIFLRSNTVCAISAGRDLRCGSSWWPGSGTPALPDVARIGMGAATDPYFGFAGEDPSASRNYAVTSDGSLWLLHAEQIDVFGPVADFGGGMLTASAAWQQDCAVKNDGSVWCEGSGYLGDGMDAYSSQVSQPPRALSLPLPAVDVVAGWELTCATLADSSVWCWGAARSDSVTKENHPAALSPEPWGVSGVSTIVAGQSHFCALKNDGSVWCWGKNGGGQLGSEPAGLFADTPHQVVTLGNDVTQIAAGNAHTCARKLDSTVWCWGNSMYGQVGNNYNVNATPIQMLGCE